ncbi:MAG TPA: VOC family protein [Chloroflexota bacterium]|jgi:hypothetical protein|nr:VOC family protein [Chloroflexota bacterium]
MHRSQLCGIVIDCSEQTFEAGVSFWSAALGRTAIRPDDPSDPYVGLEEGANGLILLLQRVDDTSRVHLDLETDDVEAEARRLEGLGATRVAQIERWWVMRAPSGHLFCVVPLQQGHTLDHAQVWED